MKKDTRDSTSYNAGICFDSLEMSARNCDLKTALDYVMILTSVKQKMRNEQGTGSILLHFEAD